MVMVCTGVASAAMPCSMLLAGYLDDHDGDVVPCLVDMQEDALCFGLEDMTVETATRTLDAHIQAYDAGRPIWETSEAGNATEVETEGGARLEIVVATDGPFRTMGTCRILSER